MVRFLVEGVFLLCLLWLVIWLLWRVRRLEERRHELTGDIIIHGSDIAELTNRTHALEKELAKLKADGADLQELAAKRDRQEELFTQGLNSIIGFGGALGEVTQHE